MLRCVAIGASGAFAAVADLTYAEVWRMSRIRLCEEWDRAAFVAFYSINANPFLRSAVEPKNPYRVDTVKVDLADVPL